MPPTRTLAAPGLLTFSASNPSIYLDVDRDKARVLGVDLSSIFQALQTSLRGLYVNDINLFSLHLAGVPGS